MVIMFVLSFFRFLSFDKYSASGPSLLHNTHTSRNGDCAILLTFCLIVLIYSRPKPRLKI
jgi:hypothetical protein